MPTLTVPSSIILLVLSTSAACFPSGGSLGSRAYGSSGGKTRSRYWSRVRLRAPSRRVSVIGGCPAALNVTLSFRTSRIWIRVPNGMSVPRR